MLWVSWLITHTQVKTMGWKRRGLHCWVLTAALVALSLFVPLSAAVAEESPQYYIEVDVYNQIVTIYDAATMEIVRQMLCSSGAKDATPTGDFTMPEAERRGERQEWFHFRAFGGYAR